MTVGDRYLTQLLNNTRHIGQGEEVIDGRAQYAQWCIGQMLHRSVYNDGFSANMPALTVWFKEHPRGTEPDEAAWQALARIAL